MLRPGGKPVRFPVQSQGEWLAILWLNVVCTTPLKRPNWFARDCLLAAQSKGKKYLRRMCSSKGEWLAIFEFLPMLGNSTSATWLGNIRFPSV
jgi:hypothetical protein